MRHRLAALYLCFFLSGVAALIYEIVWQRMLTLVFGVSTWSVAAVLTAYMAGLALGAWAFGRIADRVGSAARVYALVELGIAGAALAVSRCIDPLMDVYVRVAGGLDHGFYLTHLIRFGLALAVFVGPCVLIGATVPMMARMVTRSAGSLGVGFGRFYAVNTGGAVLGAALAGFVLIRFIGMHAAIYVAMGANLAAGLIALIAGGNEAREATLPLPLPGREGGSAVGVYVRGDARGDTRGDGRVLYVLALLAGLTGLGYEVAWARLLAVYTLNSVYVFTMLLTVFLAALAVGSAIAARVMRHRRIGAVAALAGVQMALAMTAPVVLALTRWTASFGVEYQYRSGGAVFAMEYLVVLVVVFVPTVLLGMTLPLLAGMLPGGTDAPGRSVGRLYAWNSLGCILGAALTGLVMIPLFGLRTTLMMYAMTNFSAGCWVAVRWGAQSMTRGRLVPISAVGLVGLSVLAPVNAQFIRPPANRGDGILYYAEGNSAIVHVTGIEVERVLHRTLYLDSQSVAGDSEAIITDQKMLAHLPLLLHRAPRRALTVGFGTGGTSYSMLLHEVVTHCVEIERAVPAAAEFFLAQNHGLVNLRAGLDPGRRDYRLILDDARSWLHLAPEAYDVIVDDLTSIQYRGNGNLYTRECFALMRDRLTADGIGCAWVPITGIELEPLKILVRTFQAVFPHTSVWYMSNTVNDFVILVGTPDGLMIDLDDWRERMAEQWVAQDLAAVGLADPMRLASCLLLDEAETKAFSGSGALHTDNQPLLDYLTHAGVYQDRLAENLRAMLASQHTQGEYVPVVTGGVSSVDVAETWDLRRRATQIVLEGHILKRMGDDDSARAAYAQASDMVPADATFARLAGRAASGQVTP